MCDVEKIKNWIELAVKNQNMVSFEFKVRGGTNKDDGYLSNITFVTVTGLTPDNMKQEFDLVIKSSKESASFRKKAPIKQTFEKEIFIYDRVIPAFKQLQKDQGIKDSIGITPFCYATRSSNDGELLILENLKPHGYSLCDRKKLMDLEHIRLVLEGYAKWHALSLALRKHKPEVFAELIKDNVNMFSNYFVKVNLLKYVFEKFEIARLAVKDAGELDALKKLQYNQKDIEYIMTDMFSEDPEFSVILHGDCWTNNFLFKYQNGKPVNIQIIDWQGSGVASPVFDLAFFIYACCPTQDRNVEKLLIIYHECLTATLKQLNVSNDAFSFDKLMEHWRRFSSYGMVINNFVLRFSLCDSDEAPDLAQAAESENDFLDLFYFTIKDEEWYLERVRNNLIHFACNV